MRHPGVVEARAWLECRGQVVAPERRVTAVVDGERVVRQPIAELPCEGGRVHRRDSVVRALEDLREVRLVRRDERVEPRAVCPRGTVTEGDEERGEAVADVPGEDERPVGQCPGRRGRVDIEVDHPLVGRAAEGGRASLPEPRRHARAGEKHDVGLPQGPQHGLAADQAAVPEERRVGARHRAEPHLRRSRGRAEPRGETTELGRCIAEDDPAPRHEQRPGRAREQARRTLDVGGGEGRRPIALGARVELRRFDVEGRREDVRGELEVDGSRPAGGGLARGRAHEPRDLLRRTRHRAPLRRRTHEPRDVGCHREAARRRSEVRRHAGREDEHGEAVRPRRAEAADEVVRARAHLSVAGSEPTGRMERCGRHPRRGGLVSHAEVADPRFVRDHAEERPELARGDAEQVVDPASDQRSRERGAAVEALGGRGGAHARPAVGVQCGSARPGTGAWKHGIVAPIRLPR